MLGARLRLSDPIRKEATGMRHHLVLPGKRCCGPGRRLRLAVLPALVAGGIVLPSWAEAQATVTLEELAATAASAVVLIHVETPSGSRQGSGFLVDPGGRILTNSHVIRNARSARIKLASGDVYDMVTVLAEDERRDIAVLQVPGFELPTLPLGNSDSVRIGNPVVLIGSPLGLESTVTTGIISGRRQEPEGFQLLQISAPASRGSSGGPVLNQNGDVVAIASSQMQVGQNLNFAVPINYARGLLGHLGGEPLAVFMPPSTTPQELPVPMASADDVVNPGLRFALQSFLGLSVETLARMGPDHLRRTRITFRLIETVGGGVPRIERYLESETTRRTGPFGTEQTVRRERVRTLVRADGLQPVSTLGEVVRWTDEGWVRAGYNLEFEGQQILGLITDSLGRAKAVDRSVPRGLLLREMADFAFGTLANDSLVGRSVELVTLDPWTGDVTHDRYDVLEISNLTVAGREHRALRVNVARDLANSTAWFTLERPRVLLRREELEGGAVEEIMRVEGRLP
jgi:hypothetical protein